jgi:multifunctional beta-oxidation protein
MPDSLAGKVAIVTGAGRGIGRAISEELARNGAKVIVNDAGVALDGSAASSTPADETVAAIKAAGGDAAAVLESVATWDGGQRIVQSALDNFGRLDIVVTAAGILRDRMIYNMSEQEWDDVIAVHLKGTASVVRHAAPIFRKQRSGRIITFSSESGLVGFAGQANYGAAKSGIAGFTKVVAKDLGKYGVTANSIAPRAATRMVDSIPDNVKEKLAEQRLMPRKGERAWEPGDVAPFVSYLASDYSSPINGQVFLVYGGTVTHLSLPRRIKTIYNPNPPGRWELPEMDGLASRYLVDGIDQEPGSAKRLAGKVAVVTGAGRGIGRGVAKKLAAEGASVVVADIGVALDGQGADQSPAAKVVEEISELGGTAVACYENAAEVSGGQNIVKSALDNFGRLDIVVTAAGILRDRMIFNMTEQEWDDVIAVHLKGTFSVVQPAAKVFREQGSGGRIITFSSVSGLYGYGGQANYGAAKEGIAGFTRVVAKDLARFGVTANAISPGAQTRMTDSVPDSTRARRAGEFPPAPEGTLTSDPDDVAPMISWLASDEAAGVTGMIFHTVGNRVSVMNHPEPHRSIHKDGRWTLEELAGIIPETIGMDLINPAPPQDA